MARILMLITLLIAGCSAAEGKPPSPASSQGPAIISVESGGDARNALVHAPAISAPRGVILVFHGGGGSATHMQDASRAFTQKATHAGYLVAYLNGSSRRDGKNLRTWNAGHCCAYAMRRRIDDADFVDRMITTLNTRYDLADAPVYLMGHSNGAMLSYRLPAAMQSRVDGLIIISGAMFEDQPPLPPGLSVFAIHIRDDDVLSFTGAKDDRSARIRNAPILPFESVQSRLATLMECGAPKTSRPAPGASQQDSPCQNGGHLRILAADTGGHAWPKAIPDLNLEDAILAFVSG